MKITQRADEIRQDPEAMVRACEACPEEAAILMHWLDAAMPTIGRLAAVAIDGDLEILDNLLEAHSELSEAMARFEIAAAEEARKEKEFEDAQSRIDRKWADSQR